MTLGTLGPDGLHRATEETQASVGQVAPVRSRLQFIESDRIEICPRLPWHEYCFHLKGELFLFMVYAATRFMPQLRDS
jgi:hypothetical protein